jgi:hypothetical protein
MKLIIDRQKWLRGEGSQDSYLLRPTDGKMCCFGFYCLAISGKIEYLIGNKSPEDIMDHIPSDNWLLSKNSYDNGTHNSPDCYRAMQYNDDGSISEDERESNIKHIFAKHDVEVEFIN